MEDLLVCQSISKDYAEGENHTSVLKDVSFKVKAGQQIAILGSSGSGKSTLLHILGGLDTPSSGTVIFDGKQLGAMSKTELALHRNQDLGFIYQFHHLLPEFSALENVAMPLRIGGLGNKHAVEKAKVLLDKVGLSHRLDHKPSALSGGERQRVAIARALVCDPKLVLADEPTGNLDDDTGERIYQIIRELSRAMNTAFIVVTHDRELAKKMDAILELKNGQLVSSSGEITAC